MRLDREYGQSRISNADMTGERINRWLIPLIRLGTADIWGSSIDPEVESNSDQLFYPGPWRIGTLGTQMRFLIVLIAGNRYVDKIGRAHV